MSDPSRRTAPPEAADVGAPASVAEVVVPTSVRDVAVPAHDPVVRAATPLLGGPVGRYARVGAALPWRPAAVALTALASLTLALGMFTKGHCVANGWALPDTFWRGCYSDLPFLFSGSPLAEGQFPYRDMGRTLGQPPLTGAVMWLVALVVPDGDPTARQRFYFLAWAAVTMLLLALLVRVVARSTPRDPWRAAHVAAAPVIVTTALVSPDLLGVTLASYGLLHWARSRPELAGVFFGLATAARSYPALLVLAIGLLALRAGRGWVWARTLGAAMLTYVATLVALLLVGWATGAYRGIGDMGLLLAPYRQWFASGPDYGSLWYLPTAAGVSVPPTASVWLAVLGWVVALGAGGLLALAAPQRPRVAEVALVVVGVTLLTGRALPVQAALWLVPLVALAGLRWRDHLIWATGELLYFVAIWLYLGGQSDAGRALPLPWLAVFSVLRLLSILWLVAAAWRQATRRIPNPADEVDDLAGPLAGRPDQVTVVIR